MMSHHTAHGVLAHADIDDVWIALRNGDGADGASLEKAVRNIPPTDTHVICFPKTTSGRSHVISFGITDDAGAGHGTPAAKWTDGSPFHGFENGVVIIRGVLGSLRCERGHKEAQNKDLSLIYISEPTR